MKKFLILKVGAVLGKRFLQVTMAETGGWHGREKRRWTSAGHAERFFTLKEAETEAAKHENVRIIWVIENHLLRNKASMGFDGCEWGDVS